MSNIQITERVDKGAKFLHITYKEPVDAILTKDEERIVLHGNPEIVIMTESWKFGDQIQFKCYASDGVKTEKRNPSGWNRMEIAIPLKVGMRMMEAALKYLWEKGE